MIYFLIKLKYIKYTSIPKTVILIIALQLSNLFMILQVMPVVSRFQTLCKEIAFANSPLHLSFFYCYYTTRLFLPAFFLETKVKLMNLLLILDEEKIKLHRQSKYFAFSMYVGVGST